MMKIDRKKATILLSIVALAGIIGGWYITAYAASNGVNAITSEPWKSGIGLAPWQSAVHQPKPAFEGSKTPRGGNRNGVEVSSAYNQTVINIAKNDSDVQKLLVQGYSISNVRPIIRSVVQADGTVVKKAADATIVLTKDTTGIASVWVDVAAGKVIKIATINEKS